MSGFFSDGWQIFPVAPSQSDWAESARGDALRALEDPACAHWYQCEGTWFVGLDVLDNDAEGRVSGSAPLTGAAVDFVNAHCGGWPRLHRGQVSGVFPGYPRPRAGESAAAFRYRRDRDAAHVDGVLGIGQPKRRFVQEPHAFILGLPLTDADATAAPLVVWRGSHLIMQNAFRKAFDGTDPNICAHVDVTEVYQAARRLVFETCDRVIVHAEPGAAILVHRLALHGVAPWQHNASAAPEGRLIAYFRPPMQGGVWDWATAP